jgi:hypothetical protein
MGKYWDKDNSVDDKARWLPISVLVINCGMSEKMRTSFDAQRYRLFYQFQFERVCLVKCYLNS